VRSRWKCKSSWSRALAIPSGSICIGTTG
jgi:hypothetical protein